MKLRRPCAIRHARPRTGYLHGLMSRHCAKPGCNTLAHATLTYDYGNRTAWVERLTEEDHPMSYDLCERHANGLSVPKGWRLEDRRKVEPLFRERNYLAS